MIWTTLMMTLNLRCLSQRSRIIMLVRIVGNTKRGSLLRNFLTTMTRQFSNLVEAMKLRKSKIIRFYWIRDRRVHKITGSLEEDGWSRVKTIWISGKVVGETSLIRRSCILLPSKRRGHSFSLLKRSKNSNRRSYVCLPNRALPNRRKMIKPLI